LPGLFDSSKISRYLNFNFDFLLSLSHHAEELFADLISVGSEIASRANNLQARIDRLAVKVTQMDNAPEECEH